MHRLKPTLRREVEDLLAARMMQLLDAWHGLREAAFRAADDISRHESLDTMPPRAETACRMAQAEDDQSKGEAMRMRLFAIFPVDHYNKSYREVLVNDVLAQLSESCKQYGNMNANGFVGDDGRIVVAVDDECELRLLEYIENDDGVDRWEIFDDVQVGAKLPAGARRIAESAFSQAFDFPDGKGVD